MGGLFLHDRAFYFACTYVAVATNGALNSIFLEREIRVARGYLTFGLSVWSWGPRPTSNIDGIIADNLRRRLLRVLHFSHPSLVSHVRPLVLQLSFYPLPPTSSFHHSSLPHFARREGTAFCSQHRNLRDRANHLHAAITYNLRRLGAPLFLRGAHSRTLVAVIHFFAFSYQRFLRLSNLPAISSVFFLPLLSSSFPSLLSSAIRINTVVAPFET